MQAWHVEWAPDDPILTAHSSAEDAGGLAGGPVSPTRVIVSGHSLGGGVAAIAGPWAALTWPAADVRVVDFGAPMSGNAQFAQVASAAACQYQSAPLLL